MSESPNVVARTAGALWLACIATSILSFVIDARIVVPGHAAETAAAIVANPSWFRLSVTADILSGFTYLGTTALLYRLLRPAGQTLSFAAAVFGMIGVAVGTIGFVAHLVPVVMLSGAQYLSALAPSQLQAGALLALQLRLYVTPIGMTLFGAQILLVGHLITHSTFLPRPLGLVLRVGGAWYVVASLTTLLAPPIGNPMLRVAMAMALIVEGSLTWWLLTKGVDVERWHQRLVNGVEMRSQPHLHA